MKCLCFYHPDDPEEMKGEQERELRTPYDAARSVGRELLVEIIAGKHGPLDDDTIAAVIERLYALGIKPDWWKLEPQPSTPPGRPCPRASRRTIRLPRHRAAGPRSARGGPRQGASGAARCPEVKGFAVGRTIFTDAAKAWLAGRDG